MKHYALCIWNHAYSRAKGEPIGGVECLVHVCAFQHDILTIVVSAFASIPTDLCILLVSCKNVCYIFNTIWSIQVGQGYPHDAPKVKCETQVGF